jgi:hypothetical protein
VQNTGTIAENENEPHYNHTSEGHVIMLYKETIRVILQNVMLPMALNC